jgi:hypothetical protein
MQKNNVLPLFLVLLDVYVKAINVSITHVDITIEQPMEYVKDYILQLNLPNHKHPLLTCMVHHDHQNVFIF